ncbi:hypothetical protein [Lonepinella koalarum]|uniref:hypothetical protein n=2 Tax=Lonepinella TaxID=53416 RepID=UPI001E483084|nr:hypothetical protein [Lonepinella koalarum]
MNMENSYQIPDLFALGEVETKAVLKATNQAHQALGELKGLVQTIPNYSGKFTENL